MGSVHQHLTACAAEYAERSRNPITAWDQLAADKWSGLCLQLAREIEYLSDDEALVYLKAKRTTCVLNTSSSAALVISMSHMKEYDRVIDPIAREQTGWIEVNAWGGLDDGKSSERPGYRRMLDTNHCVGFVGRALGESDEDWLRRRAAWLAQYHPDIWVIGSGFEWGWSLDGHQCTVLLGRVHEFAKQEHLKIDTTHCCDCGDLLSKKAKGRSLAYSTEYGRMCCDCHDMKVPPKKVAA
jgi:hypothetical protein